MMPTQSLYGVPVACSWSLPLPPTEAPAVARVCRGAVGARGNVLWRTSMPEGMDVLEHAAGRALVGRACRAGIAPDRIRLRAPSRDVAEQLLLGPVAGTWLDLRGEQVLHGACVQREEGGLAILGPSGSGKSTLAQALVDAGAQLITDELVRIDDDLRVAPGPGYTRLFNAAGVKERRLTAPARTPAPLHAALILSTRFTEVVPLHGVRAVASLLDNFYTPSWHPRRQMPLRHELACRLAQHVTIYGGPARRLHPEHLAVAFARERERSRRR